MYHLKLFAVVYLEIPTDILRIQTAQIMSGTADQWEMVEVVDQPNRISALQEIT